MTTDTMLPEDQEFLDGASTARLILRQLGRPGAIEYFREVAETFAADDDAALHNLTPAFMRGFDLELASVGGTA